MSQTPLAATWDELAAQLGTTRKSLLRWRDQFADAPQRRDVAAWRAFIFERNLRPAHVWESPGTPPAAPAKVAPPPAPSGRGAVLDCEWSARRSVLFEIMEFLHASYLDGALTALEFADLAVETTDHVCALARLWKVPPAEFDPAGFRATWNAVLAEIARAMLAESERPGHA